MTGPVATADDLAAADFWQIAPHQAIDWREWGDEFVVRTSARAETHLLSATAGHVLLALMDARSPMSVDLLFARAFDDPSKESQGAVMSSDERAALRAIVGELERLGLMTRPSA